MGEKVKLPKEVAEAIDYYEREHGDFWKHHLLSDAVDDERYIGKQKFSTKIKSYTEQGGLEEILQALVNGYEVVQTPEKKVKKAFDSFLDSNMEPFDYGAKEHTWFQAGMRTTLNILDIFIEGVNA